VFEIKHITLQNG